VYWRGGAGKGDLVGSDAELTPAGGRICLEDVVDELKELLHHGVLPHIVVSGLDQLLVSHPMAVGDRYLHTYFLSSRCVTAATKQAARTSQKSWSILLQPITAFITPQELPQT
jgi:hypothetical protein